MTGLPIISIKSKQCQADLGVTTAKSARRKLKEFGCRLIKGEYVLKKEVEMIAASLAGSGATPGSATYLEGSSFEDFKH